jgi:hypothetical protein
MRGRLSSKAVTPLLELVVILFFFAFMSTMVLRLFAMSYQRSMEARDINRALWAAQDVAEGLRGGMAPEELGLTRHMTGESSFTQYFDADWNPVQLPRQVVFQLLLVLWRNHDGLTMGYVTVSRWNEGDSEDAHLTMLPFASHVPIGGGSG